MSSPSRTDRRRKAESPWGAPMAVGWVSPPVSICCSRDWSWQSINPQRWVGSSTPVSEKMSVPLWWCLSFVAAFGRAVTATRASAAIATRAVALRQRRRQVPPVATRVNPVFFPDAGSPRFYRGPRLIRGPRSAGLPFSREGLPGGALGHSVVDVAVSASAFGHHGGRAGGDHAVGGDVGYDHAICSDHDVVADGHGAEHLCAGPDPDAISDDRGSLPAAAVGLADRHTLLDVAVAADACSRVDDDA